MPLGEGQTTPRFRMEAVAPGMAVWHARALPRVPRGLSAALLGSRPDPIGRITLV